MVNVVLFLSCFFGKNPPYPIKWELADSSVAQTVASKVYILEKVLYKGRNNVADSFWVSRPFLDSSNLILVKSPTSKKGFTYLFDLKSKLFLVDYFFRPPDSVLMYRRKNALLWNVNGISEIELAVTSGVGFTYCYNYNCSYPGLVDSLPGDGDSVIQARMNVLISERDYQRQGEKSCGIVGYVRHGLECGEPMILKPMIYLYPDSPMPVDVRIGPVSSLAMTYPKDDSGKWQVQAYPDGRLVERKSGKEFYGLYWEGKNWVPPASDTGVVVRGSEFAQVLDSLLELKGLNFRERQECVTFWMHSLVNSPWVMIQFFDQEFSQAHPLSVSPTPTTMLRVALSFRKLKSYVPLHPPVLTKPARRGFTVIEWGGQVRDGEAE